MPWIHPADGAESPDNARFCVGCGGAKEALLGPVPDQATATGGTCGNCNTKANFGAVFCSNCGRTLSATTPPPAPAAGSPTPSGGQMGQFTEKWKQIKAARDAAKAK